MYLIKVKSKALGDGWFRCFPAAGSSKEYITGNISYAKQYLNKNVALARKKRIMETTDAVSVQIISMDIIELQKQMIDSGIDIPISTGIIKARFTASPIDLMSIIDDMESCFDVMDISDIIRDSDSKFTRVYMTFRNKREG